MRRGTLITDQESIMPPVTIGLRERPWYGKNFLFDLDVLRKISNCSLSMYWAGAETAGLWKPGCQAEARPGYSNSLMSGGYLSAGGMKSKKTPRIFLFFAFFSFVSQMKNWMKYA